MAGKIELGEFDIDSFMNMNDSAYIAVPGKGDNCVLQIVFAIDASNSMQGYKIGAANDCVNNTISKLKSFDRGQGYSISISVIGFSSRLFRWTNGFVPIENFRFSYVETVDGLTDVNALFHELTDLSNSCMNTEAKKIVVLFSDGLSTEDYDKSLEQWRRTKQYKDITKLVVSFDGDMADPQSMDFFRGFTDGGIIISVNEQEKLLKSILSDPK